MDVFITVIRGQSWVGLVCNSVCFWVVPACHTDSFVNRAQVFLFFVQRVIRTPRRPQAWSEGKNKTEVGLKASWATCSYKPAIPSKPTQVWPAVYHLYLITESGVHSHSTVKWVRQTPNSGREAQATWSPGCLQLSIQSLTRPNTNQELFL